MKKDGDFSNRDNGSFRHKKGFTAVQNSVAKDSTLSLKAKGLYLLIQAYITIPDKTWKKSDFERMCREGTKAFNSGWDELKAKGYLHTHIYTDHGSFRNEYELLDIAAEGPHTFYYNQHGELTKTNEDRYPQNGSNGYGTYAEGDNGNGSNKNKTTIIIPRKKTFINPINPVFESPFEATKAEKIDTMDASLYAAYFEQTLELPAFRKRFPLKIEMLNEIRDLLADVCASSKKTTRIGGEVKKTEIVKSRFMKLESSHLEYVLRSLEMNTTEIRNIRGYLLTTLYNSTLTIDNYYTALVQHDMHGE